MISWHDLYTVLAAMVPLYVAMILAYGSVRWWKIFSPDQCSGINRFVAVFAVPLLSFHFISSNNPYEMNFRFIAADTLQKVIMLAALTAWSYIPCLHLTSSAGSSSSGSLEWVITLFSLSTLPNTLVMGIPLLIAMYGEYSGSLMVQVVVLQCIIWYTLLLFLFEYRGARILIMEQFPETAASIVSFKVDSDVVSLDGRDFLETDAEIGDDGKLHVTLRKSNASRRSFVGGGITPRPSNLTGAEIYSLSSSRNPTPRGSNFNNSDFYSMIGYAGPFLGRHSNFGAADLYSLQSSRGPTPRPSNFEEPQPPPPPPPPPSALLSNNNDASSPRFGYYPASATNPYPTPNPEFIGDIQGTTTTNNNNNSKNGTGTGTGTGTVTVTGPVTGTGTVTGPGGGSKRNSNNNLSRELLSSAGGMDRKLSHDAKELHMFVWSSSASPVSEVGGLQVFGGSNGGTTTADQYHHSGRSSDGAKEIRMLVSDHSTTQNGGGGGGDHQDHGSGPFTTTTTTKLGGSDDVPLSTMHSDDATCGGGELEKGGGSGDHGPKHMPPARVMTRLILIMVWRKLIRNPNTYSSLIGLIWSLVSFRWHVRMPIIIEKSISILSDAGLGMAMFSLGLFMALQPKIIACGNSVATFSMFIRFVTGPAVMAIASIAIGLKGDLLRVAIVQAALPQGIVPFVFAKEYNNHPAILSTGVIFGMLIALPIDLLYYVLLGL